MVIESTVTLDFTGLLFPNDFFKDSWKEVCKPRYKENKVLRQLLKSS